LQNNEDARYKLDYGLSLDIMHCIKNAKSSVASQGYKILFYIISYAANIMKNFIEQ